MQPLALHLVNSIFLGDYLTSEGQVYQDDLAMIEDAGFEVEGTDTTTLPEHRRQCGDGAADEAAAEAEAPTTTVPAPSDETRRDLVSVRRRGAGTDLPPNA